MLVVDKYTTLILKYKLNRYIIARLYDKTKTMNQIVHKNTNKKRNIILAGASIAILVGASLAVAYVGSVGPFSESETVSDSTIDYEEPTDEQKTAGEATKEETVKNEEASKPSSSSAGSSTPTTQANNTVGVEFTSGPEVADGTLYVGTVVQEVNSTGVCTLTLSKSGKTSVVKTAKTQVSGSVATCQGFTIDVSKLAKGSWNVQLSYKSNKSQGKTSESITI